MRVQGKITHWNEQKAYGFITSASGAGQVLRHKSRKNAFQFAFWATVVLNCAAFAWLFTTEGGALLQSMVTVIG